MKSEFPTALSLLKAKEGSPIDLQRIQNESLQLALEEVRSLLVSQTLALKALTRKMDRRTSVLTPTQFSSETYQRRLERSSQIEPLPPAPATPIFTNSDNTGAYFRPSEPNSPPGDTGLRAFVNESPRTPSHSPRRRERTQVDLVLPPTLAFTKRGESEYLSTY